MRDRPDIGPDPRPGAAAAPGGLAAAPGGLAAAALGLVLALLLPLGIATPATAQPVCAPLQGRASYNACINEQLTRQRLELQRDVPRQTPRPVPRPDFLMTDPLRDVPDYRDSVNERTNRDLDAARRDSDVRTNLLRDQVQRDMRNGPLAPPLPMQPARPGMAPGLPGAMQPSVPWAP